MKNKLFQALILLSLTTLIISCSPPNQSANNVIVKAAAEIPDGNYAFLAGLDPKAIIASPLFNRLHDEVLSEDWAALKTKMNNALGAEPGDIDSLIYAMQMPQMFSTTTPESLSIAHGPFTLDKDKLIASMEDELTEGAEINLETTTYKDKEYWAQRTDFGSLATMPMENGAASGEEGSVKALIDFMNGEGKALVAKASVKDALALIHPDSQASFVMWDISSTVGPMFGLFASMSEDETDKQAITSMTSLETFAVSAKLDEGFYMEAVMLFSTEDAAATIETFINEKLSAAPETMEPAENSFGIQAPTLSKENVQQLVDTFSIERNGKTLRIINDIPGDSPFWDEMIASAKERKKALEELEDGIEANDEADDTEQ